jgi:hypothetical protein
MLHWTYFNAAGEVSLTLAKESFKEIGAGSRLDDGSMLIFDADQWEPGIAILIESHDVWQARANERRRLRDAAPGLLRALRNCVAFWPSALNDDLQARTFEEACAVLADFPER